MNSTCGCLARPNGLLRKAKISRVKIQVPHYVKQASTEQLCQLARLLARRRLRERNYVDMVVAHLLHKIRVSEDNLTMRLLVKTANALAALECRSQPKFVEHFNRHFEHRIEEAT
eukprot:g32187.t1